MTADVLGAPREPGFGWSRFALDAQHESALAIGCGALDALPAEVSARDARRVAELEAER